MLGLSSWIDYYLMRGLAAEAGRFPALEMQHAAPQPAQPNWAALLAGKYLHALVNADREPIQAAFEETAPALRTGAKTLFSWLFIA